MNHHLAQINIALARAPLESEVMRGFTNALDEINALAEASPGFLWRLKTEVGRCDLAARISRPAGDREHVALGRTFRR